MDTDNELKSLLGGDDDTFGKANEDRISKGIKRTRTNLGQQQTMSFLLIKIWVGIAKVLAPFFALVAKRQMEARVKPRASSTNTNAE